MPDIEMAKRFAGADPNENDPVLEACLAAAKRWYEEAGVPAPQSDDPLYDFWVCNLTSWMYDNRGNAEMTAVPEYILTSVHQMRRGV